MLQKDEKIVTFGTLRAKSLVRYKIMANFTHKKQNDYKLWISDYLNGWTAISPMC